MGVFLPIGFVFPKTLRVKDHTCTEIKEKHCCTGVGGMGGKEKGKEMLLQPTAEPTEVEV